MSTKLVELYGHPIAATAACEWSPIIAAQQCPFLLRKCVKARKSAPSVTIGTCTVSAGQPGHPLVICPARLMERRQVFEDAKGLASLHQAGNEWHLVPEFDLPGGKIDYCLVSARRRKVVDFVGVELQSVDTTGTVWPERQRFLHGLGVRVRKSDRESGSSFGVNWKMTSKTALVQLHHKVRTFELLSKRLVLAIQDELLAYMRREFNFSHLVRAVAGHPMHFHSYSLESDQGHVRLQLAEQLSTDSAGIAACLGLQAEANVELDTLLRRLEAKLSDATLLAMETPITALSVIAKSIQ